MIKNILLVVFVSLFFSTILSAQAISNSDLQKNVEPINNPIANLQKLEPRKFEYDKNDSKKLNLKTGQQFGFDVDRLQKVFPSLVKEKTVSYSFGKNAYRTARVKVVDEAGLIPILVASIQQQQEEIEQLRMQIVELKKESAKK